MPGLSITADGLVKRYGDAEALHLDRLAVAPGEVVGLVGNNASSGVLFKKLREELGVVE